MNFALCHRDMMNIGSIAFSDVPLEYFEERNMTDYDDKQNGEDNPASNGSNKKSLTELLVDDVENVLRGWQKQYTREEYQRKVFEAFLPSGTQSEVQGWMGARFATFQGRIKTAQDKGELYPWIVPYCAAALLESMFQCCVGFWMLAGKPDDRNELSPSVKAYIAQQIRTFGAMVGN